MPEPPDHPAFDANIPYYDRTPDNRAIRANAVRFADGVGIHLICPRKGCRREGRCADRNMRDLPFCWAHYRGTLRFILAVAGRRLGVDGPGAARATGMAEGAEEETDARMPEPFGGEPLLARWAAAGVPVAALARSVADGPMDDDWERDPAMQEASGG